MLWLCTASKLCRTHHDHGVDFPRRSRPDFQAMSCKSEELMTSSQLNILAYDLHVLSTACRWTSPWSLSLPSHAGCGAAYHSKCCPALYSGPSISANHCEAMALGGAVIPEKNLKNQTALPSQTEEARISAFHLDLGSFHVLQTG